MSEPVSNAEIEDVLSSIRRLVSEDVRPLPSSQATPELQAVASEATDFPVDRLVLTPAFRVTPPTKAGQEPKDENSGRINADPDVAADVAAFVETETQEGAPAGSVHGVDEAGPDDFGPDEAGQDKASDDLTGSEVVGSDEI
ncbi:MAG: hypothetical protein ACC631_06405, partial [Halocynthiibacter sp.]